jgi:hypothetical protein
MKKGENSFYMWQDEIIQNSKKKFGMAERHFQISHFFPLSITKSNIANTFFWHFLHSFGAWGSVVVKALRY